MIIIINIIDIVYCLYFNLNIFFSQFYLFWIQEFLKHKFIVNILKINVIL